MRRLIFIVLLFCIYSSLPAQTAVDYDAFYPKLKNMYYNMHRVIETDSVYSFFRSNPFKPFDPEQITIVVTDNPVSSDTLDCFFKTRRGSFLLQDLSGFYAEYITFNKQVEIIGYRTKSQ